ncbi:MAG: cell division protein ZapE [Desulfomonile sp.]|nr:cell division protein ZapE [Desulfomonile sp.]
MKQLTLPLFTPPRYTFDNLILHEGIETAVSALRQVCEQVGRPVSSLFLYGPGGVGKTHILRALAAFWEQKRPHRPFVLVEVESQNEVSVFPLLHQLVSGPDDVGEAPRLVAVDDVHLVRGNDAAALWTLFNKLARNGAPLIMTSLEAPDAIFEDNPHLASRVTAGLVFALRPPEDDARLLVLDKMARDRNIRIPSEVSRYLITHKSRNLKELEGILDLLDETSLELKRRITLPLVKLMESEGRL